MSSSDEQVSQFMAFTGSSDANSASAYLEMSGGNLETAVGLYMEHNGGGGAGGRGVPGASASSSRDSFSGPNDDVRAPDATQTMRLMDDGPRGIGMMGMGSRYMPMGMMEPMVRQHLAATSAFARDVVNAAADEEIDVDAMDEDDEDDDYNNSNDDGDGDGDENNNSNDDDDSETGRRPRRRANSGARSSAGAARRTTGLADMFAPPRHLICNAGGFEGARANAKESKRWLLVNLQRDNEFSCHALNRDVWRDELVENLISEGFIFWQEMDTSPEGSIYAERYKVYDYPHVGIIDPRTRRLMWKKEGWAQTNPLTAEQFAEYAMDFCSRHSFDRPPQAPRPSGGGGGDATKGGLPNKRPMHEMSEAEQLEAAMRASLEDNDAAVGETVDYDYEMDEDSVEVVVVDSNGETVEAEDSKPPAKPPSVLKDLIAFDVGDEPEKGARIQFRMPDGKRKIRKFDPSHSVKHVYAFVAQSNPEGEDGKEFFLMAGFPPKDLIGDIESSIKECSLSGEAITVRWK
mmetsp:Transcript_59138/g.120550  ORF Transcript_59138/g.120550 Transcript_59138/m.120550 type:complete len:518 (+) Transcript_59138:302-1855(+)